LLVFFFDFYVKYGKIYDEVKFYGIACNLLYRRRIFLNSFDNIDLTEDDINNFRLVNLVMDALDFGKLNYNNMCL
jgi:hypothetical protein